MRGDNGHYNLTCQGEPQQYILNSLQPYAEVDWAAPHKADVLGAMLTASSVLLLQTLAASFVANTTQNVGLDGLQTLLSFKMANLTNLLKAPTTINKLDLNSIISQWVAANTLNIPLPTLQLGDMKITALKVITQATTLKLQPCLCSLAELVFPAQDVAAMSNLTH